MSRLKYCWLKVCPCGLFGQHLLSDPAFFISNNGVILNTRIFATMARPSKVIEICWSAENDIHVKMSYQTVVDNGWDNEYDKRGVLSRFLGVHFWASEFVEYLVWIVYGITSMQNSECSERPWFLMFHSSDVFVRIGMDIRYMNGDEVIEKKEQMRLFVSLCSWVFGYLRLVMYRSQIDTNRIRSDDKS